MRKLWDILNKMDNKENLTASIIEKFHIIIVIIYIISMVLVLLFHKYKLYASIYIFSVGIIRLALNGCPLTKIENRLRQGKRKIIDKSFIERSFRKYLNINIPNNLVKLIMSLFFILSVFIIASNIF